MSSGRSDIDLLIEFHPGRTLGLLRVTQLELSSLLGRPVDLRTRADLSPCFCDDVVGSAERWADRLPLAGRREV